LVVQQIIERDRLLPRVRDAGAALQRTLHESLSRFDEVGDVRGRGFFIGIELVKNRKTRAPFPQSRRLSYDIGQRAFADGLICYPCSGNVDGAAGDTLIIAPPYNATDVELEEAVVKLTRAIGSALSN
jgi:adenosylmethionine-8-amino-7-oxononanoate aminotransferase